MLPSRHTEHVVHYGCIHAHTHTHIYIYIYICMCIYIYIFFYVFIYLFIHLFVHIVLNHLQRFLRSVCKATEACTRSRQRPSPGGPRRLAIEEHRVACSRPGAESGSDSPHLSAFRVDVGYVGSGYISASCTVAPADSPCMAAAASIHVILRMCCTTSQPLWTSCGSVLNRFRGACAIPKGSGILYTDFRQGKSHSPQPRAPFEFEARGCFGSLCLGPRAEAHNTRRVARLKMPNAELGQPFRNELS